MAKFFMHSDGTKVMEGTHAWELREKGKTTELDKHMKELDTTWRKLEGRPFPNTKPKKESENA
jgi:hypothetical protein